MVKKYKASIYTLGCRVNLYESEAIADGLSENGFEICDFSEVCDVYIINTCTVTAESDRKSRQIIRRAIKTNPDARILVCGCYSQMFPSDVSIIENVDYIGGTTDKMQIVSKAKEVAEKGKNKYPYMNVGDPFESDFESMEATLQDRTRAFLKIEDGCNNKCSYCIIPKARGTVRSKPIDDVICEVEKIVSNGYREIVLVGIETAAYGSGKGYSLIDLLERLEDIEGLDRIRLGSIEPAYLKDNVIERLSKLKKTMPHYHLSLQSGKDKTLNAMRRRYNTKMIDRCVSYMREMIPNVTFGSDFIVGFPGETEEDFEDTIEFIDSLDILNSHIFSYSIRPGTEAAEMIEQVMPDIKEKRHKSMQTMADCSEKRCIERFIDNKTILEVLFEKESDGYFYGYTNNFIYVKVKSGRNLCGSIEKVVLSKYNEIDRITEGDLI
ncbi:MAG: tRNA (N(6)-L-threonylcarbamoyladenosine(37)-C(2))-methylthiotransferase MtaB [Ruminococcaceae bacterium]|nr:tRNA (N(6)-L-threonylcarbamoyladenosine(37)-C(2))-methylthiotransferase MtaB [Oscillospiraceae bacterium]